MSPMLGLMSIAQEPDVWPARMLGSSRQVAAYRHATMSDASAVAYVEASVMPVHA